MPGKKNMLRGVAHRLEYLLARVLSSIVLTLPLSAVRRTGDVLGLILFHIVRVRREVTFDQLKRAFPEKTGEEIDACARKCYKNLSRVAVEAVRLSGAGPGELNPLFRVKGKGHLDEALEGGKGLVVVTFHLGNWELMGAYMARLGYPLSVVGQRIHNPFIDRMIEDLRSCAGMEVIYRSRAVKDSIRALRRNRIVAILADQDAHENGVFVPFFGRSASTPRGPAVIAMHCDAPAVMAFMIRDKDGNYDISIEPIPYERDRELEAGIEKFTRTFTSRLEDFVRSHPEQWLWLHRRWKTADRSAG
jgi:KDO2-lipid IV(A) lauroyltransferase